FREFGSPERDLTSPDSNISRNNKTRYAHVSLGVAVKSARKPVSRRSASHWKLVNGSPTETTERKRTQQATDTMRENAPVMRRKADKQPRKQHQRRAVSLELTQKNVGTWKTADVPSSARIAGSNCAIGRMPRAPNRPF